MTQEAMDKRQQMSPLLLHALDACAEGKADMDRLAKLERRCNTKVLHREFDQAFKEHTDKKVGHELKVHVYLSCGLDVPLSNADFDGDEGYPFEIGPRDSMQSTRCKDALEDLLKSAEDPSNTHFESKSVTTTARIRLGAWLSTNEGAVPRETHVTRCCSTWFAACVEALTTPKEGTACSPLPLDAPFISQGLILARALLEMGQTRISKQMWSPHEHLWDDMRSNGKACRRVANWHIMRGMLTSFIYILERLQATPSVYYHILAPHENQINCILSGGLIQ